MNQPTLSLAFMADCDFSRRGLNWRSLLLFAVLIGGAPYAIGETHQTAARDLAQSHEASAAQQGVGGDLPTPALRLLVLGDSLSSAYGLAEQDGWVSRVDAQLSQRFKGRTFNASIAGETTGGGLYRLPDLLIKHQPDLVVIGLGANDGLRGLSLKKFSANLNRLVDLSLDQGAEVIVLAIPVTDNYGSYVLNRMYEIYQQASQPDRVTMVDMFDQSFIDDPDAYQEDGLHPTAETQQQIARIIWQTMEPILLDLTPTP